MPQPSMIKKQRSLDRVVRQEVIAEKRRNSIQQREAARIEAEKQQSEQQAQEQNLVSSKYPKQDILHLKEIFDAYDADGSGYLSRREIRAALEREKAKAIRYDGRKMTLAERQAQRGTGTGKDYHEQGVFLVDFAESFFRVIDTNSDGRVEFVELLRLLYPFASEPELATMLAWAQPKPPAQTFEEFQLSPHQRREVHSMFHLYDKDNSGGISYREFREAMRRCGLDLEEIEATFAEADVDGNRIIDIDEFTQLMKRNLFENAERFTFGMLYGPIDALE